MSVDEIIRQILTFRQDLNHKAVTRAIEKKKINSFGLLTNEAIARLVAAEYGLKIEIKKSRPRLWIAQIVSGLNNISISGRVFFVGSPKTFSRPTGSSQVARILIADKTGSLNIVLWGEKAKLVRNIKFGQIVKVLHGYTRQSRKGCIELHIGMRGNIQLILCDIQESDFPPMDFFLEKIVSLKLGSRVNVMGLIQIANPLLVFSHQNGTPGKVIRILIEDETGNIPVVFWNNKAEKLSEELSEKKEGVPILLMNVKVKTDHQNKLLELHVDNSANFEFRCQ